MTPGPGHNMPPPFEAFSMELDEVFATATDFLDGAAIETQGQAEAIGIILANAKRIKRDADKARTDEKAPHLEAGKAVDAKWKPLAERCDAIVATAGKPLTAYLAKVEAEQREQARIAREEAARAEQAAIEAQRAAGDSLAAVEAAQALQRDAEEAAKLAAKADKAKAHVAGEGRAIGLRTSWAGTVTDRRALLEHIMRTDPETLTDWLAEYARKAVARGVRAMPGVLIEQERKV
jgi:hypothetical protein